MKPADYHRLTFAAKRARVHAKLARPLTSCPACGNKTEPGDLLRHLEGSCPGRSGR